MSATGPFLGVVVSTILSSADRFLTVLFPERTSLYGKYAEGEEVEPDELAAAFEEGRAPSPGPVHSVSRIRGNAKKTTPAWKSSERGVRGRPQKTLVNWATRDLRFVVPSTNTVFPFC